MVKNFQPTMSLPSRKRVSFDVISKMDVDYSTALSFSVESDKNSTCIAAGFLNSDNFERLLKVAQTLNARRADNVDSSLKIARNSVYSPEHRAYDFPEFSNQGIVYQNENISLHLSEAISPRHRPTNNAGTGNISSECHKMHKRDIVRNRDVGLMPETFAVGSMNSHVENIAKESVQSAAVTESSRTVSGNTSLRESGDALDPCRGYSNQKRHGRKASLGAGEITKLIPTLVSENEEFRCREYRRKVSLEGSENEI